MHVRRLSPRPTRSLTALAGVALTAGLLAAPAAGPASATPGHGNDHGQGPGHHGTQDAPTPAQIALPDGFQPEGIATGEKNKQEGVAYLGSRADGDIYRADLSTGRGKIIAQGPGTPSLGMKVDDRGRLFVAGGTGGDARVIDTRTGRTLASYQLIEGDGAFINDVVLTKDAAWFTDSMSAQLFKVDLTRGNKLPSRATSLPLTGEWRQVAGLNANGISTTPDGKALIVVNTTTGDLFRVDPRNGRATVIDVEGDGEDKLVNGDGLLREGTSLYAVQNQLNRIAVVDLARDGRSGVLDRTISSPRFDIPTTVARSGDGLYLPNARFSTPPTPQTEYSIVRVGVPEPRR